MRRFLPWASRLAFLSDGGFAAQCGTNCRAFAAVSREQSLQLIKDLRSQTGAPISDVRAALEESQFDVDAAYGILRKKGAAAAAKKANRDASQGLVTALSEDGRVALVEINCETDFVSRNESFQKLMPVVARAALAYRKRTGQHVMDVQGLSSHAIDSRTVADAVKDVAGVVRENVVLRAAQAFASSGYIATYVHNCLAPGCGAIATAVALENDALDLQLDVPERIAEVGKHLAMQVAAMDPVSVDRFTMPSEMVDTERQILMEQAKAQKPKNADVLTRIVAGRLEKYYETHCLVDQNFIMDDKLKVKQVLKALSGEFPGNFRVSKFAYMKVGSTPRLAMT